jgi:hypothetical protein
MYAVHLRAKSDFKALGEMISCCAATIHIQNGRKISTCHRFIIILGLSESLHQVLDRSMDLSVYLGRRQEPNDDHHTRRMSV